MTRYDGRLFDYALTFKPIEHRELEIGFDNDFNYKIINEKGTDFKILQLTDIHLGGSYASYGQDKKAMYAMYQLILKTKPDLIILTGDMLFVSLVSRSINNSSAAIALKAYMDNIGIPWTMTFGNHDSEFYNTHSNSELRSLFTYSKIFLFSPLSQTKDNPYSNQIIKLYNGDGTINNAIILMDSNQLIEDEKTVTNWYKKNISDLKRIENKNVPSLLFMHMPLYEYEKAYDLYEKNSSEVVYHSGKKRENVYYEERTDLFSTILEEGSTKGIFVGHDHLNDFSIEYKDVLLTYGKSIDYITYPNISKSVEQRGATLITIHEDSSFDVTPISLEDIME